MATKKLSEALAELQKAASVSGLDVRLVVAGNSSTDNAKTITLQQLLTALNIPTPQTNVNGNTNNYVYQSLSDLTKKILSGMGEIYQEDGVLKMRVKYWGANTEDYSDDNYITLVFPKVTTESDGSMEHSVFNRIVNNSLEVNASEENVAINYTDFSKDGSKSIAINAATESKAGIMTAEQVYELSQTSKKVDALSTAIGESSLYYGIEFDVTVSSPTCTRIGSTTLHKSLPIQNRMRGCLLDDDGNVAEYLDDNDWTSSIRDGSRGQVMVEIPLHYRKFEEYDNKRRVLISEYPIQGFDIVPKSYISAYEASIQRSTNKLCSVVNTTTDYRGGNNKSEYDTKNNTLLGRPATSISRINFRKYARNRKADSTEWNCITYDLYKTLFWLFVIEYATLNSQAAYNSEQTSEGFKQGGLGIGVTNIEDDKWNTFNGHNPFIPCGYTDKLGNRTGVVEYTMPTEYNTTETKVSVPRYRGIENPFGHIWKWIDGVNIRISANEENGGDGLSKVFVCHDPANFNDTGYNGYSQVGNEARIQGFIKEIIFGVGGEIIPKVSSGGSSTTYFCDYHFTNIPTSGSFIRGLLFGGYASDGASAGFAYAFSSYAPSVSHAFIGSRLCFIPRNRVSE